ncbi:hypothetical protein BKA67DRAFT_661202 [Truncatella angustata]|uniref:Uncharacterized protein n=1 Tax=Truncatella angustata TaxID=152316 RepID=A0A9P8UHH8_9PEZI|nr:uncharacterized protein BKA67DRAFT_661202 [Truncatella angustata]KAH6652462.1 hypothetical protein BKA67DRAFT_661202 [Truncatella angustata]KAH8198341.1 hypothetical protein TruAng_007496 [Truncatella angustata]
MSRINVTHGGAQNYPWRRIAPGTYTQDYDSFLTMQHMWNKLDASGRRLLQSTSYVRIQTEIPDLELEQLLRNAWVTMRYENPGLALELEEYYKVYKIPYPEEVDEWLSGTFHTFPTMTAEEAQKQHLLPESNPHLYWLPQNKELLLVGQHCYFDARTMWVFWGKLLDLVVSPRDVHFGDEWKRLPLARDDLIGMAQYPTMDGYAKAQTLVRKALHAEAGKQFIALPPLNIKTSPDGKNSPSGADRNGLLRYSITVPQTEALVRACKQAGVSVTAAYYTALSMSCRKIQAEHGTPGDLALSFHNFDARSWFAKEVDIDSLTLGTDLHGVLPFCLDLSSGSFENVAGAANDNFKTLRDTFAKDYLGLDAINHLYKSFFVPGMPISTFPNFSSFGIAERFLKSSFGDPTRHSITVEDTYTVNHSMLEGMSCVTIWTWQGRFHVAVTYNEAYHTEEMFQKLMRDSCDTMLQGLGISLNDENGEAAGL